MKFSTKLADNAALLGYGLAAAFGMGFVHFASYFVFGTYFALMLTLAGIGFCTFVALGFVLNIRTISRPKWLYLWMILMGFLTLAGQIEAYSRHASAALLMFVSTIGILICGIFIAILSQSWDFRRYLYIFPLTVAFVLAAALVIVDPIADFRSSVPGFSAAIYERSRAGGLFLQPNLAAIALNLMFLALLPRVARATATLLAALLTAAVVLTFSRFGLL
jgi:hypothetical protein